MQSHRGVGLRGGRVKCTVTVTPNSASHVLKVSATGDDPVGL
jgi:hypothetical protein